MHLNYIPLVRHKLFEDNLFFHCSQNVINTAEKLSKERNNIPLTIKLI